MWIKSQILMRKRTFLIPVLLIVCTLGVAALISHQLKNKDIASALEITQSCNTGSYEYGAITNSAWSQVNSNGTIYQEIYISGIVVNKGSKRDRPTVKLEVKRISDTSTSNSVKVGRDLLAIGNQNFGIYQKLRTNPDPGFDKIPGECGDDNHDFRFDPVYIGAYGNYEFSVTMLNKEGGDFTQLKNSKTIAYQPSVLVNKIIDPSVNVVVGSGTNGGSGSVAIPNNR